MKYKKDKIKRLIEYKDNIKDVQLRLDFEWLIECYNDYYVKSKEYEIHKNNYKRILNKYYNLADEKANLKEVIITLKKRNKRLKELYDESCKNFEDMI